MSALEAIVSSLLTEIDRVIDRKLDEKLPELLSARDSTRNTARQPEELVDALAVARFLGRDISTSRRAQLAKQHVYDLARRRVIPSIRITPKRLRFDLEHVREVVTHRRSKLDCYGSGKKRIRVNYGNEQIEATAD